ncbi:hypothetical protein AB9F35_33975, partial [Rhizobium leguminosarum]
VARAKRNVIFIALAVLFLLTAYSLAVSRLRIGKIIALPQRRARKAMARPKEAAAPMVASGCLRTVSRIYVVPRS